MDSGKQTLVNKLEHDIANVLLDKLEYSDMSFERASLIAKFVLAHLPENLTDAQLETILPTLDSEFIEIAGVVHRYMNEYEKKYEMKITEDVRKYAIEMGMSEDEALSQGLKEKSKEFLEEGAEIYTDAG